MSHSVLLVDDDPSMRSLLDMMLTRVGYITYQAEDAQQAIELIDMTMPDLFIIDVMMPGMTGFELCQHLRTRNDTAQHPILLLSARTDEASISEGLQSGANLYLTKPIAAKELIAHIQQFLGEEPPQELSSLR
jgi:DNA-binding response OmpR family regulator